MSSEIHRKTDQASQASRPVDDKFDPKSLHNKLGDVSLKDKEVFRRLIRHEAVEEKDEPADGEKTAVSQSDADDFARLVDRAAGRRASGDDERQEDGDNDANQPAVGSMFDLYGKLSSQLLTPNRQADPAASSAGPDLSRQELAARIADAAESMAALRDPATGRSELRVEFKPETLPDTVMRLERNDFDNTLVVEFTTANAKVNMFLENSNASLRESLVAKFGGDATVRVVYNPPSDHSRQEADDRGRRPDWTGTEGNA